MIYIFVLMERDIIEDRINLMLDIYEYSNEDDYKNASPSIAKIVITDLKNIKSFLESRTFKKNMENKVKRLIEYLNKDIARNETFLSNDNDDN